MYLQFSAFLLHQYHQLETAIYFSTIHNLHVSTTSPSLVLLKNPSHVQCQLFQSNLSIRVTWPCWCIATNILQSQNVPHGRPHTQNNLLTWYRVYKRYPCKIYIWPHIPNKLQTNHSFNYVKNQMLDQNFFSHCGTLHHKLLCKCFLKVIKNRTYNI